MRFLGLVLLAAVLAAGDAPVFTDQEWNAGQPVASQPTAPAPGWGAVATMGVGLVLVVGLAIGLGWAARRLNARRLLGGKGRSMELVETIQLAPRRQLALVRLGGQHLVVGIGEKELTHIATLPVPAEPVAEAKAPSPFASELNRLVAQPPAGSAP